MKRFQQVASDHIPTLQATLEQYVEPDSGARHVHLASNRAELAFLVAFPTVPQVSDGRAHILEHLALCGSQRYPVADPFFAMMRRSTATFMNAMTYADRTVYPFASTDRTDFFNLLDVYLDATFFPKLDYLSFRQEGWRHSFKDGKLIYQGVVFNEMKGAFGDPMRALNHGIDRILLAGTTYAVESGGDPLEIPSLDHEALKAFHARHYHPSQAMFMTAGKIDAAQIQAQLGERVLSRASGPAVPMRPALADGWDAPRQTDVSVPSLRAASDEFGLQLAWRLGESSDQLAAARARLLVTGLMGDSAAPLLRAMESAGFGRPSRMSGAFTSARQIVIHAGMAGLTQPQVDLAHACIRTAMEEAARAGVAADTLRSALRDMRYQHREVRGGSMPDALGRMLNAVPVLMNGGDVRAAFDNTAVLDALEQETAQPQFFQSLVRGLLDNPNCLISRVVPDAEFAARRTAQEDARLAAYQAQLSEQERQRIEKENEALDAHRKAGSDTNVLPRIAPSDVGAEPRTLPDIQELRDDVLTIAVNANGITYGTAFYDVTGIPRSDWDWLALYADVVPQLGVGERTHSEASAWRRSRVSSFDVYVDTLQAPGHSQLTTRLAIFASVLSEDKANIAEVIEAWAQGVRFDELERIGFLVRTSADRKRHGLAEAASHYAALAAAAPFSERRRFDHEVHGLASLEFWSRLRSLLLGADGVQRVAEKLEGIHQRIVGCPRVAVWSGSEGDLAATADLLRTPSQALVRTPSEVAGGVEPMLPANLALVTAGQVNHCHIAWSVPGLHHDDAPALAVVAELMSQRILHTRLREQGGAYGGTATYSAEDGVFSMNSARDPRLAGTYADFAGALDELVSGDFSREALEEAIIGVIRRLDNPPSPYSEALEALRLRQLRVTAPMRRYFRGGVLTCTIEHAKAAGERWLLRGTASRAAAVGCPDQDLAGLQAVELVVAAG